MGESEFRIAWIMEQRRAIGAAHNATEDYRLSNDEVKLYLDVMNFALIFGWYLTR
jgi:hypothetical protein